MHTSRRMQALAIGRFAVVVQIVVPTTPALAASGTATVTGLIPASGPAGSA